MSDVDRLFREYVSEHRAGGVADPVTYLEQVSPSDRSELAALIDGYLSRTPRRSFDPEDFDGSNAEDIVGDLERSLGGRSGLWPAVLPDLRHRAGVRRSELVKRLAAALGVAGREGKVGDYYHQMEQGLLPSTGVSDRVLAALAEIVGSTVDALRSAGEGLTPFSGEPGSMRAFARRSEGEPPPVRASPAAAARPEMDEVDRLFRSG